MQLTVVIYRQSGEEFIQVQVGPDMTIADLKGVIEAEANVPAAQLDLFVSNQIVSNNTQALSASGLNDGDLVGIRIRRAQTQQRQPAGGGSSSRENVPMQQIRDAAERLRLQALGQPDLLASLREQAPDLANAIQDSNGFAEQYVEMIRKQQRSERERQEMIARLEDDPFDVEAQRKIEDIIRQQQVMRNYEDALENTPEAFGRVTMLYIPVEVNGTPVKAFVDSGAQATIMSPACAEKCGIMRLLDKRFAGVAKGVGTAKILGRVHSAQLKVGTAHLPCSFTVMEGKDVDLLFGLDMLKRHQAIIDLAKNALIIQGETIQFLSEAELPKSQLNFEQEPTVEGPAGLRTGAQSGAVVPSEGAQSSQGRLAGQAIPPQPQAATSTGTQFPAAHIDQLVALGFSRDEAINALRATNGDVDQAGAILFG